MLGSETFDRTRQVVKIIDEALTAGCPLADDTVRSGLKAGDPGMLLELYDRTADAVYGYLLRLTRSPHNARTVSLQAYSYVWRHPDTLADVRVPVRIRMVMLAGRLLAECPQQPRRPGHRPAGWQLGRLIG